MPQENINKAEKTLLTFIAIKYSKKIYKLRSLLLFQRLNSVYEFMAYWVSS